MKEYAPIILFVYNRPEHTRKVVEGLLSNPEAKESVLYVFADGVKPHATDEDKKQLLLVRAFIHTITGFKNVVIEESEENRGLANSTIYGCTKVINKYGSMIMMEDDDVPNKYFLSYVNRCLIKYKDDYNIWCVSGYTNTSLLHPRGQEDLFLVNRPSSWGFGTWKRCWDKVVWDTETLNGLFKCRQLCLSFDRWGGRDSSQLMKGLLAKKNSSWSIRFNFAAFLNNAKTILPNHSLIENIGCDGTGTHCGNIDFDIKMINHPVEIPHELKFDVIRNKQLWESFNPKKITSKIKYFLSYYSFGLYIIKILGKDS